jgi:hypothetical protein
MPLNLTRSKEVFDPAWLSSREVHVIGAGTLGSRIIAELVHMGVPRVHVYDDDVYAEENISTQTFLQASLKHPKPEGAQAYARATTGLGDVIVPHCERVVGPRTFGGFVFTAVDSMTAREDLWLNSLRFQKEKSDEETSLLIDSRMGPDGGRICGLDPNNFEHVARYEEGHLYSDKDAEQTGCATHDAIGGTASIVVGHALWRFIAWIHFEQGKLKTYDNFMAFYMRPRYKEIVEQWYSPRAPGSH